MNTTSKSEPAAMGFSLTLDLKRDIAIEAGYLMTSKCEFIRQAVRLYIAQCRQARLNQDAKLTE
jgi:hypothetical protein